MPEADDAVPEIDAPSQADMPAVHAVWIMWKPDDLPQDIRPDWSGGCDLFQVRGALERALTWIDAQFFAPPEEGDLAA